MTDAEIAGIRADTAALRQVVEEQAHFIARLQERIRELEGRLAKDRHTRSKPPTSDGLAKKTVSLRTKSGRRPGGSNGHPGTTLRLVDAPDDVVVLHPATCPHCQTALG